MPDPKKDDIFPDPLGNLRRDFFGDALREAMGPLSNIFEKKVNPLLRALNDIPQEIDRLIEQETAPIDQPHLAPYEEHRRFGLTVIPDTFLRPPGALPPGEFETQCSRCGRCMEVCPANAIKIDPNQRIAGGYPFIVASDRPCVVCDELACMKECPSSALRLVDKLKIKMGTAKIDQGSCLRSRGEDCKLCLDACPIGAAAIYVSETTGKMRIHKNGCIGCGLCENACPTEPRSIIIRPTTNGEQVIIS